MSMLDVLRSRKSPTNGRPMVAGRSPRLHVPAVASGIGGAQQARWDASGGDNMTLDDQVTASRSATASSNSDYREFAVAVQCRLDEAVRSLEPGEGTSGLRDAREQVASVLSEIDARLGGVQDTPSTSSPSGQSVDVHQLAELIAARLHTEGLAIGGPRRKRGRARLGETAHRRPMWSALLHVDVLLSSVALVIAVVVLVAWMG